MYGSTRLTTWRLLIIVTVGTIATVLSGSDDFRSKNFFCKRCGDMEYCASLQMYKSIAQIECYKIGMILANKEKADGTELLTTLTTCQLPIPIMNGEEEYLINATGDGDTSSPNCKRTYVRQLNHGLISYFTDEMACVGYKPYPYVCERELDLSTTPTSPSAPSDVFHSLPMLFGHDHRYLVNSNKHNFSQCVSLCDTELRFRGTALKNDSTLNMPSAIARTMNEKLSSYWLTWYQISNQFGMMGVPGTVFSKQYPMLKGSQKAYCVCEMETNRVHTFGSSTTSTGKTTEQVTLYQDCADPTPAHSTINTSDFTRGSVVAVTCDSGFTLIGVAEITCKANRTWSSRPTCVFVEPPWKLIDGKLYRLTDIEDEYCNTERTCRVTYSARLSDAKVVDFGDFVFELHLAPQPIFLWVNRTGNSCTAWTNKALVLLNASTHNFVPEAVSTKLYGLCEKDLPTPSTTVAATAPTTTTTTTQTTPTTTTKTTPTTTTTTPTTTTTTPTTTTPTTTTTTPTTTTTTPTPTTTTPTTTTKKTTTTTKPTTTTTKPTTTTTPTTPTTTSTTTSTTTTETTTPPTTTTTPTTTKTTPTTTTTMTAAPTTTTKRTTSTKKPKMTTTTTLSPPLPVPFTATKLTTTTTTLSPPLLIPFTATRMTSTTTTKHTTATTTKATTSSTTTSTQQSTTTTASTTTTTTTAIPTTTIPPASWIPSKQQEFYVNRNQSTFAEADKTCRNQLNSSMVFFTNALQYLDLSETLKLTSGLFWVGVAMNTSHPECLQLKVDPGKGAILSKSDCRNMSASICSRSANVSDVLTDPTFVRLIKDMTIDSSETQRSRRKLVSVYEERKSATAVGSIGVAVVASVFAVIALMDLSRLRFLLPHNDATKVKVIRMRKPSERGRSASDSSC